MQSAELRYIRSLNLIIRGADTLTLHFALCILHFPDTGEGIKNTHPLKRSGVGYKSIPRVHPGCSARRATHWHYNGCIRQGISSLRLRSGILSGRVTDALHQNGTLSGNLSGKACLRHSFFYVKFSTFFFESQSPTGKNPVFPKNRQHLTEPR